MIENHERGVRNGQPVVYRTWLDTHPCLSTLNSRQLCTALKSGLTEIELCAECLAARSVLAGSARRFYVFTLPQTNNTVIDALRPSCVTAWDVVKCFVNLPKALYQRILDRS
jgi:hypothetical protein